MLSQTHTHNLRNTSEKTIGPPSVAKLRLARLKLVSLVQYQSFATEIKHHQNNNKIQSNSKLRDLNPLFDSRKFPLVLPSNHTFTKLMIEAVYKDNFHPGTQTTAVRQSFCSLNGRRTVRNVIRKCIKCFRANSQSTHPLMGNLPKARVCPTSRPFLQSGVDYYGPFLIKDGSSRSKKSVKIYIAIFMCCFTKATHIEIVNDLTTEAFLAALNRFISRRLVTDLFSDNGTNFTGANAELKTFLNQFQRGNTLNNFMITKRLIWHFISPRALHFGGLWKATIKSTKHHLKRVAAKALLTYDEIHNLL